MAHPENRCETVQPEESLNLVTEFCNVLVERKHSPIGWLRCGLGEADMQLRPIAQSERLEGNDFQ